MRRIGNWGLGREQVIVFNFPWSRGLETTQIGFMLNIFSCRFGNRISDYILSMCDELRSDQSDGSVEQLQQVVECLLDEEDSGSLDECLAESLDECEGTKSYPCGLCTKICKSKVGLTLHSRAKHPNETVIEKLVSPIDSRCVEKMVLDATESLAKCDIYGLAVRNVFTTVTFQPTELLVQSIKNLYAKFCRKCDRDKLLMNLYKLIPQSANMFLVSNPVSVEILNLIMVNLPDLLVSFYKRGEQNEDSMAIEKSLEESEYGPLSYVAGYIIGKLYRMSKFHRSQTDTQIQIQCLLLSLKSADENEYINSLSRGGLWVPCGNLVIIAVECEKFFRKYTKGVVKEVPLTKLSADILEDPKVKSAWEAILLDASQEKDETTRACLQNIVMLYIRVRAFSYTKDIVTQYKLKEKLELRKKALRKELKKNI